MNIYVDLQYSRVSILLQDFIMYILQHSRVLKQHLESESP